MFPDQVDLDPGQGDLDAAMAKMSRRAISDKMYKADVEVRQESKTRCSMASYDVLQKYFGNGQDQVQ